MVTRFFRSLSVTSIVAFAAACSATGYAIGDLAPEINATWDRSGTTVAVGDVLFVAFPFKAEWNHEARVRSDGTATFRLLDAVQAAGLTLGELDDRLSSLYREKATATQERVELTVDVRTAGGAGAAAVGDDEANGRSVYVIGEVERPGPVPVAGRTLTLVEAIAAAGGHKKATANLRNTILVRRLASTGAMKSWRLDADIYAWGKCPSILLQPRDIVFVPNTAIDDVNIWVDKYIRQMLPFPYLTAP